MSDFEIKEEDILEVEEDPRLGFIKLIGEESDGYYRYEFIFTNNINEFWGENFEYKPCCLCNGLSPDEKFIWEVHTVKMKIKLELIQDNCCFSFSDATDGIIAIAWEDISEYDEYPEEGRIFFRFGETLDEVEEKLAVKHVLMIN
jgi:hypothetical protein